MEEHRERIEHYLLKALAAIDGAIINFDAKDERGEQIDELMECKKLIKRMLNRYFDRLARQNNPL